jgi:hypothetical protein
MKRVSILGIFLILIGVLLLLSEMGIISFYLKDLLRFWPLIFIFWGLDLILGEKRWFSWILALVIIGLIILIIFFSPYGSPYFRGRGHNFYREWRYPFRENLKSVSLSITLGSRNIWLGSLEKDNKEDLIYVKFNSDFNINKVKEEEINGSLNLYISFEDFDRDLLFFERIGKFDEVNIEINPNTNIDLEFNSGVGNSVLDMRNFKLNNLKVKGGVGNLKIYLPKRSCYVEVEGGVGNISVYIPKGSVLDLTTEAGIGNITVDKNIEQGKEVSKEIIHLRIKAGVGNIKIISEGKDII